MAEKPEHFLLTELPEIDDSKVNHDFPLSTHLDLSHTASHADANLQPIIKTVPSREDNFGIVGPSFSFNNIPEPDKRFAKVLSAIDTRLDGKGQKGGAHELQNGQSQEKQI